MNKYFYRIAAVSTTGRAIRSFHRQCQKAERAQAEYAKKVGATAFYEDFKNFAGGVVAVVFSETDKVNRNVWRFVSTAENGEKTYVPNTVTTVKTLPLNDGQSIPKSSARRVYSQTEQRDSDGHRSVKYIEVEPATAEASKSEQSRAVTAEILRLQLPVVSAEAFYEAVHADKPSDQPTTVPTFFLYRNNYYIGLESRIHYDGIEEITSGQYIEAKNDMLFEQRTTTN